MERNDVLRLNPRDPRRHSARLPSTTGASNIPSPSSGFEGLQKSDSATSDCDVVSSSLVTPEPQRLGLYRQPQHPSTHRGQLGLDGNDKQWETDCPEHSRAPERAKELVSPDTTDNLGIRDAKTVLRQGTPDTHELSRTVKPRRGPQTPPRESSPRLSSRELRHECFRCSQRFETRSALNQHLKASGHQLPLKKKVPRCLICQEVFPNWKALEKHIKNEGHIYSRKYGRSSSRKKRSRSESEDEWLSPKRKDSRRITYCVLRSPRRRYSSSSSSRDSSRSRDRSSVEKDHIRFVKYRDDESSTWSSPSQRKSPEHVPLIPLEAGEGHNITDPRTAIRKKSRFIPKRIPVAQNKITVLYKYFPNENEITWKLIPVEGNHVISKEKTTETCTNPSNLPSVIVGLCSKEEIDAAVQQIATLSAEQVVPNIPSLPVEPSKDASLAVADSSEGPACSLQETLPSREESLVVAQSAEEELAQPGAMIEERIQNPLEVEPTRETDHFSDKLTEEARVLTPPLGAGNEGGDDQLVPAMSEPTVPIEFYDDVEEKMAKLFGDEVAKTASTDLPGDVTCYMYYVEEAIDLCPECQFDLNSSPLVTVNVVTGDVLIDCTDCGTRTVMEGVYTQYD